MASITTSPLHYYESTFFVSGLIRPHSWYLAGSSYVANRTLNIVLLVFPSIYIRTLAVESPLS